MKATAMEELMQLLRTLGAPLTSKLSSTISFLFQHRNVSSVGAIAGLAIALLCTWRYLKAPANRRKRQPKQEISPTSSASSPDDNVAATSTGVARSITQTTQRGVVIQDTTPVQLTLAQTVRRQLKGGRKMTCQLFGVVFQEGSTEDLQTHAVVRPEVVEVLLELARATDLYLMAKVADDASEEAIMSALESMGLFSSGGLNRNKVLFCSTEAGRASFVRQLEPDWHVDTSAEIIGQLARYIHHQLLISVNQSTPIAPNVIEAESLESFFGGLR